MSFASTPLGQGRRLDHHTFLNQKPSANANGTTSNTQIHGGSKLYRQQSSTSYPYGASTAVPPPNPDQAASSTRSKEQPNDSEEPALVRFARLKQREQVEQQGSDDPALSRLVSSRIANTTPNPDRWSVKDTSVNIASAFHQAASYTIPAYDSSTSSGNSSLNTTMNPNDSWASGTQRMSLPRSTSVEYEKETQSTVNRRLAAPPSRGLPRTNSLSRTSSMRRIDEVEAPRQQDRAKSPLEQVVETAKRLAPATFFMRRQSEEPEARHGQSSGNGVQDQSSSYDYSAEEREFLASSQLNGLRKAAVTKKISTDNMAYQPTVSDMDDSDEDYGVDGKRTRRKKTRKGVAGGPLNGFPVAGYSKRRQGRSGAQGGVEEGSSEEDEVVNNTRSSVPLSRRSVQPDSSYERSGHDDTLEVESGLQSIPEEDPSIIEELLEEGEDESSRRFSVGVALGRTVHAIVSTFWWILATVSQLPLVIGRLLGQLVKLIFLKPFGLLSTSSAPLAQLGKYAMVALSIYAAWSALNSGYLALPSRPAHHPPVFEAPQAPATDISELSSRLLRLENAIASLSVDTERARHHIEGDSRDRADMIGRIGALESRIQKEALRILDTESKLRSTTSQSLQTIKQEMQILHAQLEAHEQRQKNQKHDDVGDKEARAKLKALEDRIDSVEGGVKEAIELGKNTATVGGSAGSTMAWWNKVASGKASGVTIKSSDGQDVTTLIDHLVESAVSRASKDTLARVDYAMYSSGARVIPGLTSETYELQPRGIASQIAGYITGNGYAIGRPPVTALHHETHNGHCWPFVGSQGQLGVLLAYPVRITDITIDHVAREVSTDLRSAPREFELWGLIDGAENRAKYEEWMVARKEEARLQAELAGEEYVEKVDEYPESLPLTATYMRIGSFTYDVYSPRHIQTFSVPQHIQGLDIDFGLVVLHVKSNWGRDEYTCLYRFRVHGERIEELPAPYPPPPEAAPPS